MPAAPSSCSRTTHVLHPWHGVSPGARAPEEVTAFIELVPSDTVKYEVDKASGLLKLDRPQLYSSICPAPYGFIPQTYCGAAIGRFAADKAGKVGIRGDGDPLDICVLSERAINQGNILVTARPIGGYRMFDGDEADDKILAVLVADPAYGTFVDIQDVPASLVERLRHYFLTYKDMPGDGVHARRVEITHVYGRAEALEVIRLSQHDYANDFGP
jgi:inorganic pyrophosphatase